MINFLNVISETLSKCIKHSVAHLVTCYLLFTSFEVNAACVDLPKGISILAENDAINVVSGRGRRDRRRSCRPKRKCEPLCKPDCKSCCPTAPQNPGLTMIISDRGSGDAFTVNTDATGNSLNGALTTFGNATVYPKEGVILNGDGLRAESSTLAETEHYTRFVGNVYINSFSNVNPGCTVHVWAALAFAPSGSNQFEIDKSSEIEVTSLTANIATSRVYDFDKRIRPIITARVGVQIAPVYYITFTDPVSGVNRQPQSLELSTSSGTAGLIPSTSSR